MATEKFTNSASSTLNGAINNSVTSLVITSGASFPSAGQFRILIDTEIMIVTAVSGTTYTVTRGAEGTTAASHSNAATITHIYTAGAMNQSIADDYQVGTYASLPASEKAGRVYLATDMGLKFYDNGSAWVPHLGTIPFTAHNDSGYSWVNQGSAAVSTSDYSTYVSCVTNGNTNSYKLRVKSYTNPKVWTICFSAHYTNSNAGGPGFCFRESGTSKFVSTVFWTNNNVYQAITENWTNETTFSAGVSNGSYFLAQISNPRATWVRFEDNGTNLRWYHSCDGFIWTEAKHSPVARTAFFSTAPNQFGYFLHPKDQFLGMRILSWVET